MTQNDMAAIMGVKQRNIAMYESGRLKPRHLSLQYLREQFNCSPDWIKNGLPPAFNNHFFINLPHNIPKHKEYLVTRTHNELEETIRLLMPSFFKENDLKSYDVFTVPEKKDQIYFFYLPENILFMITAKERFSESIEYSVIKSNIRKSKEFIIDDELFNNTFSDDIDLATKSIGILCNKIDLENTNSILSVFRGTASRRRAPTKWTVNVTIKIMSKEGLTENEMHHELWKLETLYNDANMGYKRMHIDL